MSPPVPMIHNAKHSSESFLRKRLPFIFT